MLGTFVSLGPIRWCCLARANPLWTSSCTDVRLAAAVIDSPAFASDFPQNCPPPDRHYYY